LAILNSLLVNGNARVLNKLYCNDLDVGGDATFTTLSVADLTVTDTANIKDETITGTATFSRTTAPNGKSNTLPAMIVGGTSTTAHLAVGKDRLHAKTNATSVADLYLNNEGGRVFLSSGGTGGVYANAGEFHAKDLYA